MEASMHEAKTQLSRLIESMLAGEDVVVTRGRKRIPIAKIVPFDEGIPAGEVRRLPALEGGKRPIGLYAGQFEPGPAWAKPVVKTGSPQGQSDDDDTGD